MLWLRSELFFQFRISKPAKYRIPGVNISTVSHDLLIEMCMKFGRIKGRSEKRSRSCQTKCGRPVSGPLSIFLSPRPVQPEDSNLSTEYIKKKKLHLNLN